MTKDQLLASGSALVKAFCEHNGLDNPPVRVYGKEEWRFSSTCAYYRPVGIHIAPSRCAHPGRAGRAWSWPGYVIDRTPHGVMAHELGHHVDYTLSSSKGSYGGDFSSKMRERSGETKLTNYCPNDWEWFAEMFRLFVTNPDLLRAVRPRTFREIADVLKPVEKRPWREVLADAPARTVEMAARKVVIQPALL